MLRDRTMFKRKQGTIDTTPALLAITNLDSTVPELERAADEIRAAHPERPRAYLVTILAAEALEARDALRPLQERLKALEAALTAHLAGCCESCFWRDGETCLKFSAPHVQFGFCRAGYRPNSRQPEAGGLLAAAISASWTS